MANEPEGKVNNPPPADPFGVLSEAAVSMHELFVSYCNAGFTEEQSMYLLVQMMGQAFQALEGE